MALRGGLDRVSSADDGKDPPGPGLLLVPDELRRVHTVEQGSIRIGDGRLVATLVGRPGPGSLLIHHPIEVDEVDLVGALGDDLLGQLDRKSERVVQLERGLPCQGVAGSHSFQRLVEQLAAGAQGPTKLLLLPGDHGGDRILIGGKLRVGLPHDIDRCRDQRRHDQAIDTEEEGVTHCPPDQSAKHIAASFVGRNHLVADQEGRGAPVIGHDAQRDIGWLGVTVSHPRLAFGGGEHRPNNVSVEYRIDPLEHGGQALQAGSGVDVLCGKVPDHVVGLVLDELHEHQVPDLHVSLVVDGGATRFAVLGSLVEEDLGGLSRRAGDAHLPEVFSIQTLDALRWHADPVDPDAGRLVVGDVHRVPQPLGIDPVALGDELVCPGNGLLLEIVAEGEVAEHLEERQMPLRGPDDVDVAGPAYLLHGNRPWVGRRLLPEHVGLELDHPGTGDEQSRIQRYQ